MSKYVIFTLKMANEGTGSTKGEDGDLKFAAGIPNSLRPVDLKHLGLDNGSYDHDFGDGWKANITTRVVSGHAAMCTAMHDSAGFEGYEWMCKSILRRGVIDPGYSFLK